MGPLEGISIIEIKGLGPGPYAGMLLADLGADVIVVERASKPNSIAIPSALDVLSRGKRSIALDLKTDEGREALLKLVEKADALFEGFRPGVAERLGFGPDICLSRNPALVYGRMTGWGQTGPLSKAAGHDINYISLTGALAAIGTKEKPIVPLNLVGDYAGGGMFLAMGIVAALLSARSTGEGQVVDAAIVDGAASLMSVFHAMHPLNVYSTQRESNVLDGGAFYYDVYETSDGKFISLGPLEPQFWEALLSKADLDRSLLENREDPTRWSDQKALLTEIFKSRSRDEWCELLEGTDACFSPVLDIEEAPHHPHNVARDTYININGITQPAPAPRFDATPCSTPNPPRSEGSDTMEVLEEWGFSSEDIQALRESKALT